MSEAKPYIAIPVNEDGESLWDDHFGEAPRFHLYDHDGHFVEKRDNPHWQEDHDVHTGPKKMTELLPECGVFIARAMGNGQKILPTKFGVQPHITTETTVQGAVAGYLADSPTTGQSQ
jgi:predicted Fe-Mo cluster-binding NifX family protein